jgi:hypothetical protein
MREGKQMNRLFNNKADPENSHKTELQIVPVTDNTQREIQDAITRQALIDYYNQFGRFPEPASKPVEPINN